MPKFIKLFKHMDDESLGRIITATVSAGSQWGNLGKMSKLGKAVTIASSVVTLASVARSVYFMGKDMFSTNDYTIVIDTPNSPLYSAAESILMDNMDNSHLRSFTASVDNYNYSELYDETTSTVDPESVKNIIKYTLNESVETTVNINGHSIHIRTDFEEVEEGKSAGLRRYFIVITAQDAYGLQEVQKELTNRCVIAVKGDSVSSKLHTYSYGRFNSKPYPRRPKESVILRDGVWDSIYNHVKTFVDSKDKYERLALPYHTGVLLYGPPGTGKTSVIHAISTEFKMDVYQINLSSIDNDDELAEMVSDIPGRSIILLEDVDVATPSIQDRNSIDSSEKVSLSGLLNVLDGSLSPTGSVIFMTTNDIDSIDSAVLRPGRSDLKVELSYMDQNQLSNTFKYFLDTVPEDTPLIVPELKVTSAEVTATFRNHINDLENAVPEIINLVSSKTTEVSNV